MNNAVEINTFEEDLGDNTDNPKAWAKSMKGRSNLVHTASGQILLLAAWSNDKARRKFDMYPEIIGGDDTKDTNSEDRPLYTMVGFDNNNSTHRVSYIMHT